MKATVRQKKIKNGKSSLYLDFYPAIVHPETGKLTRREFLGLYIFNRPDGQVEKTHNKNTKNLAKNICAKRQISIQNENFDFLCKDTRNESFISYFKKKLIERQETQKNYPTWKSSYSFIYRYSKGHLTFKQVNEKFCNDFKNYLLNTECLNSKNKLAHNSGVAYFNVFREAVNEAYNDGFFKINPLNRVKSIQSEEKEIDFLTIEEIEAIAKIECKDPVLKRAGLFSALTGLRWGDIESLRWAEVQHSKSTGYYLRFTTNKTNRPDTINISENAFEKLGDRGLPIEKVFNGLKYGNNTTSDINIWLMSAGVVKEHFTFHCFRHTYATLQITLGTELYTVSKLLGHKNIKTTQRYANVIDKKKQEAAAKISKLNI